MASKPDKTLHEDLGLTSIGATASYDGLPAAVDSAAATLTVPGGWFQSRRVWIAAAIVVCAAAEVAWGLTEHDPLAARRNEVAAMNPAEKAALAEQWRRFQQLDAAEQNRLRELVSSGAPERENWEAQRGELATLDEAERAAFSALYERYGKLDATEQDRLRKLHAEVAADADPASLQSTIANYLQWKAKLKPEQEATLAGLMPTARVKEVKQLVDEQQTHAARHFSDADAEVLLGWLEKQIRPNQDKIVANLPESMKQRIEEMDPRQRLGALMFQLYSHRGPGGPRLENVPVTAYGELRAALSPQAREHWDATGGDVEALKRLLGDWIRQSMERGFAGPMAHVDEAELRRFFETELTEQERQQWRTLPDEEMFSQLRREYARRKGGWGEPGGGKFFGPFNRPYTGGPGNPGGRPGMRRDDNNGPGPSRGFGSRPDDRGPENHGPDNRGFESRRPGEPPPRPKPTGEVKPPA